MKFRDNQIHLVIIIIIAMISLVWLYSKNNYLLFSDGVSKVEITVNSDIDPNAIPILYLTPEDESQIDFSTPFKFEKVSDSTYISHIDEASKLRFLRLYMNNPGHNLILYDFKISSRRDIRTIDISKIDKTERLQLSKLDTGGNEIKVFATQSYIQLPQKVVYMSDLDNLYLYLIPLIIISIAAFFAFRIVTFQNLELYTLSDFGLPILILSVFCPAPVYNIALILAVALNLKKLKNLNFAKRKMSLILIAFFLIYLINNLFFSTESYHDMSTIDRLLPLLVLSLIIPVINNRKSLVFFPITALILGFGFLATSLLDAFIFKNEVYLSFDFFTKYLHPIYFSYLLYFSICYVHLNIIGFKKYFLIGLLFVFMIFSGSKMVLIFTLIAMFIDIVRINHSALLTIPLFLILIIFSPLKERFNDVLNMEDISILHEEHIDNPYDARINGLTLRLILWREALATMHGADYLIGTGTTDSAEEEYSSRISQLGLTKHVDYNPHNQYVETFWRTGILGFIFLLLIPIYGLIYGFKNKDILLIQFSVFMIAVMFSESIFGRVNGIYFFSIVLLMLTNPKPIHEDSNHRN